MRLSKLGYYGDFVVYPVAIAGVATFALWRASPGQFATTVTTFVVGLGIWTLVEYILHRYVLHHVPYIKDMHGSHHNDQTALIGTPIWLSLALFVCLVYLPLQLAVPTLAGGLTAGFMAGYLWYVSVHHLIHHNGLGHSAYADRLKRRHMLHHHFDDEGNFGVTSGFWDRVFATAWKK
jgi:sterol desaturase/sphingolipid hydroxylase (fatty acid hydroxylase superfamily)